MDASSTHAFVYCRVDVFHPLYAFWQLPKCRKFAAVGTFLWYMECFNLLDYICCSCYTEYTRNGLLTFSHFIFGYVFGPIYAYIAALSAAWFTFVIGRWMGGKALTKLQHPRLRQYLSQVETRPIRTLIVLRIFLQFSPLVGYTLALTNIQQHKYFVGNVLGLLLPTIVITILTYCFEDFIRLLFL